MDGGEMLLWWWRFFVFSSCWAANCDPNYSAALPFLVGTLGEFENPPEYLQGPGRVRAVKPVSTAGTTHPCSGGQPGSLTVFRQSETIALENCDESTAPFSVSAYTV